MGSLVNVIYHEPKLLSFRLQRIQLLITENTNHHLCIHFNYTKAINVVFPSFSLKKKIHNYNSGRKLPNKQEIKHILFYHLKNSVVRISYCTTIYFPDLKIFEFYHYIFLNLTNNITPIIYFIKLL